jgi:hypothetical protein
MPFSLTTDSMNSVHALKCKQIELITSFPKVLLVELIAFVVFIPKAVNFVFEFAGAVDGSLL